MGVPCLNSTNTGCILSRFYFVNNSDSVGYFHLRYGVTTIIRDSVIVLNATSNTHTIPHSPHASAVLQIEDMLIVTSTPIGAQSHVTTKGVVETDSAPTHTPFHSHSHHSKCFVRFASQHFSSKFQFHLQLAPKAILPTLALILSTLIAPN